MWDRCIVCGKVIPEGRQVCPNCEKGFKPQTEQDEVEQEE